MGTRFTLLNRDVAPFFLALLAMVFAALLVDAVLHAVNVAWLGRYLGIPGVLLIIGSFGFSLRKRKLITRGHPARLLWLHERMAWSGCLLVLVHAGIHFNAILGWLAVWALLVNVGSGLTGKYLMQRSRLQLAATSEYMRRQGLSGRELEEQMYWDSLTFDVIKKWRAVHYPITLAFSVLAIAHIVVVFLFWGWK
jgi:hypothetical protein